MRPQKDGIDSLPPDGVLDAATSIIAPRSAAGSPVTWRVLRVLGVGGMARVSLAEQWQGGRLERLVAIKRMHEHLAENEDFVRMFFDESRLASAVQHPNVVRVLDVYARAEERFIVMEYVEGYSLARIMQHLHGLGRRLPLSFALRVVVDTLRGLHAAHEARDPEGRPLGIIHRDVAPQNILISAGGVARITDFGVARAVGRLSVTAPGLVKGHLAYVAPEVVSGNEVTHRADIFAAGVILWEALSGRRLMAADSPVETLRNVAVRRIPPPIDAAPLLSTVCARALERDPARRHPTARAFAVALEDAATRLGVSLLRGNATAILREMHEAELANEQAAPLSGVKSRAGVAPPPHRSGSYAKTPDPARLSDTEADAVPASEGLAPEDLTVSFMPSDDPDDAPTITGPCLPATEGEGSNARKPAPAPLPLLHLPHRPEARRRQVWVYLVGVGVGIFAIVGFVYTLSVLFALAARLSGP